MRDFGGSLPVSTEEAIAPRPNPATGLIDVSFRIYLAMHRPLVEMHDTMDGEQMRLSMHGYLHTYGSR